MADKRCISRVLMERAVGKTPPGIHKRGWEVEVRVKVILEQATNAQKGMEI
jgi:hypothetical protein